MNQLTDILKSCWIDDENAHDGTQLKDVIIYTMGKMRQKEMIDSSLLWRNLKRLLLLHTVKFSGNHQMVMAEAFRWRVDQRYILALQIGGGDLPF
jgi:hypothetical protein